MQQEWCVHPPPFCALGVQSHGVVIWNSFGTLAFGGTLAPLHPNQLHRTRTARYFLDQVPLKRPQAHPFPTLLYHPCLKSMPHCRP